MYRGAKRSTTVRWIVRARACFQAAGARDGMREAIDARKIPLTAGYHVLNCRVARRNALKQSQLAAYNEGNRRVVVGDLFMTLRARSFYSLLSLARCQI